MKDLYVNLDGKKYMIYPGADFSCIDGIEVKEEVNETVTEEIELYEE